MSQSRISHIIKCLNEHVSLIIGATCPGCGCVSGKVCKNCQAELTELKAKQAVEFHGDVMVSFFYGGKIRDLILAFKYRNQRSSIHYLSDAVAERVQLERTRSLQKIDLVTWSPTTRKRKSARGYDQSELIARNIAKQLHLPCRKLLTRVSGDPQTGRSQATRLIGPTFLCKKLCAEHVLVFDDVITTGATLERASHALYQAGAGLVSCVAIASTVLWRSSIESCAQVKGRK